MHDGTGIPAANPASGNDRTRRQPRRVPNAAMDRSLEIWMVFRRPSRARGGLFALPGPDTRRTAGRYGEASTRRRIERELRADVGAVLLLPEEILHREGRSSVQTERADAL